MKILLVNDDGVKGEGLISVGKTLVEMGIDLTVVAPDKEMSCTGHGITFNTHLNYDPIKLIDGARCYALKGTPVDCVKFGTGYIMETSLGVKPDLILSGINNTCNIGTDVLYSGTVSAAIEGSIMGYKSIALSYDCKDGKYDFVCDFVRKNLFKLVDVMNKTDAILNINFPFYEKVKGVKFCSTGERRFNDSYQYVENKGFYITGYPVDIPNAGDSDVLAYQEGYVTIAPIKVNLTDKALLRELKDINL